MEKIKLTILAADVIAHGDGRFVFEYASLNLPSRAPLDYCHDDSVIIGYAENFVATDDGVTADAILLSDDDSPSERAREVAYSMRSGVPFECSALIDLDGAEAQVVDDGKEVVVNGRNLVGPFVIYRNATLRGVAICPHGADPQTSAQIAFSRVAFFKKGEPALTIEPNGPFLGLKKKKLDDPADPSNEPTTTDPTDDPTDDPTTTDPSDGDDTGDDTGDDAGETSAGDDPAPSNGGAKKKRRINPELQAMIDVFGPARAIEFYAQGFSMEQARLEDAELRRKEDAKTIAELRDRVKALEAKLERRGDPVGVKDNPKRVENVPMNALEALAAKYKKNGVVRL